MANDVVRINNAIVSWGSIVAKVNGRELIGFTSIEFGDSLNTEYARGFGRHQAPMARSRGEYDPGTVKLTGYVSAMQALREQLAQEAGQNGVYGLVEFVLLVQYIELNEDVTEVEILGCRWSKNGSQHSSGAGPLTEDAEFTCMGILRNGTALYDLSNGAPYT